MKGPSEDLGKAAWEALQRLVRERLARKPGGHLIEAGLDSFDLRLRLEMHGDEDEAALFNQRLTAEIDQVLDDAVQHAAAFRPGHVYCHRCASVACEHSRPGSSRHVFIGYAPTGLPRWEDFAQYCLETRHPDVDRLYRDPPALLTLLRSRDELHAGMLDAFKNPSYELLGQLVAGFFPVRARAEEGRGIVALTVQVAASYARNGQLRMGLNLLGRTPSGHDLESLWDRHSELPWYKPVRWAQSALQTVASTRSRRTTRPNARAHAAVLRRVDGILQSLVRRLERDRRSRSRRTGHAEQRHLSGDRPTRKAIDDARQACGDTLLVDGRSGTLVVLGDRGRTHFFSPEGRLVSSVRYSRDAIERKLKTEMWRPASSEAAAAFRARLPP